MKKIIITAVSLFIIQLSVNAQSLFITKGKIEFEKKVNVWKDIDSWSDDGDGNDWLQTMKKIIPQFELSYFNLLFDNTFLIQDSSRKIDWRITGEQRTIAGFECRKAVGRIMDSVYVIAFYTDQITTNGGPESFNGLPGMILGVAIPRINTTWFATKLELVEVKPQDLTAPVKGKKVDQASLLKQLQGPMKDWGKSGQRNIWKIMI